MTQRSSSVDLNRVEGTLSSRYWRWSITEQNLCPPFLFDLLSQKLPHITPDSWGERVDWGGAYHNGAPVFCNVPLSVPCKVEYYEPKFDFRSAADFFPPFRQDYIVYEDENLIAAYKPPQLSCHPPREQAHFSLRGYLEKYCGCSLHMPNRLDMAAQGLVIASKNEKAHRRLQRGFERRLVKKSYLLEVSGLPGWQSIRVDKRIVRDHRHQVLRQVDSTEGKRAVTDFTLMAPGEGRSLLLARPLTGRTHQIRLHAAYLNHSIVGDDFYNGEKSAELRLLSFGIMLYPPAAERKVTIMLPQSLWPEWLRVWKPDTAIRSIESFFRATQPPPVSVPAEQSGRKQK